MDFLWHWIIGPVLTGAFLWVPTWVWIIVGGLVVGWAFKTFGWQGVVGAALAILTIGAYRQGFRDRGRINGEADDAMTPVRPGKPPRKPMGRPGAPSKPKTGIDPSTGTWYTNDER